MGQNGTYRSFFLLLTLRISAQFLRSFGKQIAQLLPTFLLIINNLVKSGKQIKKCAERR